MIKHVYIHIPFCKYICTYCDFCKKYIKNQPIDAYLNALEREINSSILKPLSVKTIYIGGGTPSALTIKQIKKLGQIIRTNFSFDEEYEFTFECNPDDVNNELIFELKQMGVNRISMGVQTINDERLVELKRKHTKADVENALELLQGNFTNVSCDFIFNLPNQTLAEIKDSITFIKKHNLSHVSYYGLILEENTILDTTDYELKDEDVEADWYNYIQKELTELGYNQYEISNFAKSNLASIHNLAYWQQKEYYGFGIGASGYVDNVRTTNTRALKDYLSDFSVDQIKTKITKADMVEEKIFLNLRTTKGIETSFLKENNLNVDLTFFEEVGEYTRIKPKYLYESSELIVNLLVELEGE